MTAPVLSAYVRDPGDGRPDDGRRPWTLAASLATHGLLLVALTLVSIVKPAETPPVESIDVQIVGAPAQPGTTSAAGPVAAEAASPRPTAVPVAPLRPDTAPPSAQGGRAGDGMIHPSHLLAQAYIRDPASRDIRKALPKLAPSERLTQLCNIEAGQQIQAASPKVFVDTVRAYALGDTAVDGLTITAPMAAYRSNRNWYAVSFVCTVAPDFGSVTDFRFKVGGAVPRNLWEAHYLNAEDASE